MRWTMTWAKPMLAFLMMLGLTATVAACGGGDTPEPAEEGEATEEPAEEGATEEPAEEGEANEEPAEEETAE
jgi:hypothetical protein